MNFKELSRPLDISDIDFRVQSINNGGYATILAYKDARVDMARLDAAVGPLEWQRKHEIISGNLYCHVGIFNPSIGEWVWKCDVGTESMTEATKGQSSDSFKRACFNWGIGRELYDYPMISVKLNDNEWSKDGGRPKQTYNLKIRDWVWYSEFTDDRLSFLAAKDENGKVRFKWGTMKPKQTEPEYKPASGSPEASEEVAPEPVVVKDEDANVAGMLKKKNEELDEERELLISEYTRVIGKKPDGRMKNETMKKAIDDAVAKEIELPEELIEDGDEPAVIAGSSIRDCFDLIEGFKIPEQFIAWAKEVLTLHQDTEDAQTIDDFKTLCNNHYKKIAQ
jgi:hypothetical protein